MKPTERFSNRAEDYRRYRPGYPAAVIDFMRDTCGLQPGASVADIGSGTGIFTKLLLDARFDVTAVEPNEPMRLMAEQDLGKYSGFRSLAAAAEQTGLPDASFAAITVAQAFHWFDRDAARREFQRLLSPGGWVLLIWNERRMDTSPFVRDYVGLLRSLGERYETVARSSSASRNWSEFFDAGSATVVHFDNPHVMDWPGLRGRFLSCSYAPLEDDPRHEDYLSRLEHIFRTHAVDSHVTFDQTTDVYCGKLA